MYLKAQSVDVFPISRARSTNPTARLISEEHLLNLVRSICDTDSFVVTKDFIESNDLEFMIHGYYFKILGNSIPLDQFSSEIWATIYLDTSDNNYVTLFGSDSDEADPAARTFNGLNLTSEIPTSNDGRTSHTLLLLKKDANNWIVPDESRLKFDAESIRDIKIKWSAYQ